MSSNLVSNNVNTEKLHISQLRQLRACDEAIKFASQFDNLELAWQACERGDWMLWLIGKQINCEPWTDGRKQLLACALDCAETVKHLWADNQKEKIANAIQVLRNWISGEATIEEAKQARRNLYAAAADAADAYAAAAAAAYAAAADAAAAAADAYAAAAADAADAYAAAAAAARTNKLKECANIVRVHYPNAPIL